MAIQQKWKKAVVNSNLVVWVWSNFLSGRKEMYATAATLYASAGVYGFC